MLGITVHHCKLHYTDTRVSSLGLTGNRNRKSNRPSQGDVHQAQSVHWEMVRSGVFSEKHLWLQSPAATPVNAVTDVSSTCHVTGRQPSDGTADTQNVSH